MGTHPKTISRPQHFFLTFTFFYSNTYHTCVFELKYFSNVWVWKIELYQILQEKKNRLNIHFHTQICTTKVKHIIILFTFTCFQFLYIIQKKRYWEKSYLFVIILSWLFFFFHFFEGREHKNKRKKKIL